MTDRLGAIKETAIYKLVRKVYLNIYKAYRLKYLFPSLYRKALGELNRELVLFVEPKYGPLSNSLQQMYDRVKAEGRYEIRYHCLMQGITSRKDYRKRCRALFCDAANAAAIFTDDACEALACVDMRPETHYVNLWHGCGAFKRFGLSVGDLLFGLNTKQQKKYPTYRNLELVTVSSPEVEWAYREAMGFAPEDGVVKATGISRTDVFFDQDFIRGARERVYAFFPEAKGKKLILYAPTFRGRVASAEAPDQLDIGRLHEELGGEYALIVKHHPFVQEPPAIPEKLSSFARDATRGLSIEDLICTADVCISDYSSLIFEYSLMEKPMLFFAYDLDEYMDWRGFYYQFEDMTPGPVCRTNEELIQRLRQLEQSFDPTEVRQFREKFMSACDGQATERIYQMIFKEERS